MKTAKPASRHTQIKIAFDTCILLDWHKRPEYKAAELEALAGIFQAKAIRTDDHWYFVYLDAVRREVGGMLLDKLAREVEIQNILSCFDETVSLSRIPMIVPFTVVGKVHTEALHAFQAMSVSRKDSVVLADAVFLGCSYLVTTDNKLLRNDHAVNTARATYGLVVVGPVEFLELAAMPGQQ
jgi:hypothetical protein